MYINTLNEPADEYAKDRNVMTVPSGKSGTDCKGDQFGLQNEVF